MLSATLRLFHAVQVPKKQAHHWSASVLARTIRRGYVLDPAIEPSERLLETIESVIGLSGEEANAAFHKSWSVIQNSPLEVLIVQQIFHYLTTYGFEALGIYHQQTIYIPHEKLEIPGLQDDFPLVVIKAMEAQEILAGIISLGAGVALSQPTLEDIMTIIQGNAYESTLISQIANRELKTRLYDYYGLAPTEPLEFLRYLVQQLTGESLLIKNAHLIEKLKQADALKLEALMAKAPADLASIFLRFKPLFLAMKSIARNKTAFNQLRKKAKTLHKPLPVDYLNSVTNQVKHSRLDLSVLETYLQKASIFRKIRLAYALKWRVRAGNSIVYRIRNGRGWATQFDWPAALGTPTQQALDLVLAEIENDLRRKVEGRTIYIPAWVHYALPATEKQFTGQFPTGSYLTVPQDMIVGIHWTNTTRRIDLDLSLLGSAGKIGWDALYRSADHTVLFSGDMTDAPLPRGASELFYLKQARREAMLLMVNYFNFAREDEVDGKIMIASDDPINFGRNYLVDPNRILTTAAIKISQKQNLLGLVVNIDGENRVYLANTSLGTSVTSSEKTYSWQAREYLLRTLVDSIDFRALLGAAGANLTDQVPAGEYLDLSPENLDPTTLINLIKSS